MAGRVGCDAGRVPRSLGTLFVFSGSRGGVTVSARGHQGTLEAKDDDVAIRPAKSLK